MKPIKRLLLTSILLILMIFLYACANGHSDMSEQHYKYGEKAITIIDQYLNYDISAEEAYDQIQELQARAEELPNTEYGDANHNGNYHVEYNVTMLSYSMMNVSHDPSPEHLQELQEARDKLASCLGKK